MLFLATLLLVPVALAATEIQVVTVGDNGAIKFSPDTITAPVGSEVEFQFFGPQHSVVQANFDAPCQPLNNGVGFFAGMQTSGSGPNPTTFTITVNDTQPIWFYCAFPGHCQAGMVGVINQASGSSNTLDAFQSAAAKTSKSTTPANQQGGVFGPFVAASSGSGSSSSSASSGSSSAPASGSSSAVALTSASSVSSSPSTTPTGSSNSSVPTGSPTTTTAGTTPSPQPSAGGAQSLQQAGFFSILAGIVVALI